MYRMVLIPNSGSISEDVINFMKDKFKCSEVGIYIKFRDKFELDFPEIHGFLVELKREQIKEYSEVPGFLMQSVCKYLGEQDLVKELAENIEFVSKDRCDYYYGFFPIDNHTLNIVKELVYGVRKE